MPKKAIKEIYKDLEIQLTEKSLLREVGMQKRNMLRLLEEHNWRENIGNLLLLQNITCKDILDISKTTIEAIDSIDSTSGKDWLKDLRDSMVLDMFPKGGENQKSGGMMALLRIIRIFINYQNERRGFDPTLNIALLSEEEIKDCGIKDEYTKFLDFWNEKYVYEFMLIFGELTPYNTLGHIGGVHFVAMHMARQLKALGLPVDIALVSGAAAGHDLGKYGCKPSEAGKVPYLHYYYTNKLFKENHMPTIAHIATNHSTWDLELENLSVESLILIYSDFRVKSTMTAEKKEVVRFYSLKESFDVILNKLDDVDEKKRQRYVRVYLKLRDFENYMKSLGVSTELNSCTISKVKKEAVALLNSNQAIEELKFLAIEHNITLMNKFNNDISFANLLEAARSEKQWKNIRAYLNIFNEYSTYMTQKQKLATLNFLYELLMHREGDIRRRASSIMGSIIVHYDEEFKKELPADAKLDEQETTSLELWENFLQEIIFPDYKVMEQHKRWIGYSLKTLIFTLIDKCNDNGERNKYLDVFFRYFENVDIEDGTAFTLLGGLMSVPLENCSAENLIRVMNFGKVLSNREHLEIKIGVLRFAKYAVTTCKQEGITEKIKPYALAVMNNIADDLVSVMYLKYKILVALSEATVKKTLYEQILYKETQVESELYLENLKVGTPWIIKEVNIEFLLDKLSRGFYQEKLHIATHLSNLIKVSERITVRHSAGKGLLKVIEMMTLDQRNEIIIELTKGLEIGEYQFSKYIPEYLGELAMYLHPRELDELIKDLKKLEDSTNSRIASVTLDTIGFMVRKYGAYKERFKETSEEYEQRRSLMLGMLLRGLSNYDEIINQEAFFVIGQDLFGSGELRSEDKNIIFKSIYKKTLTLITDKSETELAFFNNAAALNQIYRFISDYIMEFGCFDFKDNSKIAFFPGTFDPFSLSHKGIVQEIKKLGFEVYLALDEFSWSKKTQPRMIRKQIVSMSVADEEDVYIFPESIAVNIANSKDLKNLKDIFKDKELYMVVGSDVILNASSYKKKVEPHSIHNMNHIVFQRVSTEEGNAQIEGDSTQEESSKYRDVKAKVIELKLPVHLEDISSTRIRENIDNNRDISNLIGTVAQNYIYENSLYLREPQYKSVMSSDYASLQLIERDNEKIVSYVKEIAGDSFDLRENLKTHLKKKNMGASVITKEYDDRNVLGMTLFHEMDTVNLYREFDDRDTALYMREYSSGRVLVLDSIMTKENGDSEDLEQIILTETIAQALKKGFTYAVYNPMPDKWGLHNREKIENALKRQGFIDIHESKNNAGVYFVDMKSPIILFENMEMRIKGPFNKNKRVQEVLRKSHQDMQDSLTRLYKGRLVLSFNSGVMYNKMVSMITSQNGVSREVKEVRTLGPYMCVPFGKTLEGRAVPNTVTKTLHTEKVFDSRVESFKIKEYPYYATLENQIRTIKSFNRPILLVDDLLHKGYRLKELDPIFKKNNVKISKIIVGVLSGTGKDLMEIQKRKVESVYFIPNLKTWFADDAMYPFIGGDSIAGDHNTTANLIPSVNLILPYAAPGFFTEESREAIFDFSLTCLKGSQNILEVLEQEFQKAFERNLTLSRLNEVIISPRCPDKGQSVRYDENIPTSVYVLNDIENLMRLKNIVVESRRT